MTAEQERQNLFAIIWRMANELRGSVDGWDFKQYVFAFLFYRFLSENLVSSVNKLEHESGNKDFNYAEISDRDAEEIRSEMIAQKGYFILPSELFCNVADKAEREADLNIRISEIFKNITSGAQGTNAEDNIKGLFDSVNLTSNNLAESAEARREKLVKILHAVRDLPLAGLHSARQIDVFGDAYEYLMTMYAASAGKSGGEFFTPQEVSELLAHIAIAGKSSVNKVYDPACGSGSLLLKFAKILGRENIENGFYGQEINPTTYNLCRMNMFLHDISYAKFNIQCGDTLKNPKHWDDEPFEAIVSNPPYSIKWEGDDNAALINDERFAPAGALAPRSKADLAFVMHSLNWLAQNGTAAIVSFPGVMYRGGKERQIRKYLVDNNFVDCVIQLPADLFFGTNIATCILVLKKSRQGGEKILFIDASQKFIRGRNKNKLSEENIAELLQTFEAREEKQHFAYLASAEEIAKQDYNLSVGTYIAPPDTREKINIAALNAEIAALVAKQETLRRDIDAIITEIEAGDREAIAK